MTRALYPDYEPMRISGEPFATFFLCYCPFNYVIQEMKNNARFP